MESSEVVERTGGSEGHADSTDDGEMGRRLVVTILRRPLTHVRHNDAQLFAKLLKHLHGSVQPTQHFFAIILTPKHGK